MTPPKYVPGASPGASPEGRTPVSSVVRPAVPTLTGRTTEDPVREDPTQVRPQPGTNHLITNRTRPFWNATRDLLISDLGWHHRDELYNLGKTHGLAERTVANLLPRASKRRWISRSRGHVRLRDRAALEAALAMDAGAR